MKLYIPTCTLNFNNIFTTESISPRSYYEKRGFGNKRYYPVEPNAFSNAVMLYSKYPQYNVYEDDLENYAMVIEIESDDYPASMFMKVLSHNSVDIYACTESIYFNVFHTLVYFNSYRDLQSVLSKSEQSLEAKYAKIYTNNLRIKQVEQKSILGRVGNLFSIADNLDYFKWDESFLPIDNFPMSNSVSKDVSIDRIKGFVYCYLIGCNLSVSPEVGQLKAIARRMKNTLSAIVNSPGRRPTDYQDESLTKDVNSFNSIYKTINEEEIYNRRVIEAKLSNDPSGLSCVQIIDLLKRLGVYNTFKSVLRLKPTYNAYDLFECINNYTDESFNRAISSLQYAIKKCEISDRTRRDKVRIESVLSIYDNEVSINENSPYARFYEKIISSQMCDEYVNLMETGISDEPLALTYNGGKILKNMMKDKWDGSNVSLYINAFLTHLQESTLFNIFSFENPVLNSFVAFCQKGDNIDRLQEYLIQCGFSDYKYAFGIYGATRGFASLPKTFTSVLIDDDKEYFRRLVCTIYGQIFHINLTDVNYPEKEAHGVGSLAENPIGKKILENIDIIEAKPHKQETVISAVSSAVTLEDAVQSPKAFMFILDSFQNIKRTKAYKNLIAANFAEDTTVYSPEEFTAKIYQIIGSKALKDYKDKIDKAIELEAERQNPDAFLYILDNFLKPTDAAYKKISSLIRTAAKPSTSKSSYTKTITSTGTSNAELRPINKTSNVFVDDKNAAAFILTRTYLPENIRQILFRKIMSFQDDYAAGGYYYGRDDSPRTNDNTIKHFINKCTYQKGSNPSWIPATSENKQFLERLKKELYDRYAK